MINTSLNEGEESLSHDYHYEDRSRKNRKKKICFACSVIFIIIFIIAIIIRNKYISSLNKEPDVKEPMFSGERITVHVLPHSHDDVGWLKTVD